MTIRILLAAALLAPMASTARAQGWGADGTDPNRPASSAPAPAPKPVAAAKAAEPAAVKVKAKAAASNAGSELDDAALDQSRALVDRQLIARKSALAGNTQRLSAYHMAMEKDSMDTERQLADERKAYLLYLKSVPQEDRADAMKTFEARQEAKRKDLDKRHLSQYKAWFDESISSNWRSQPLAYERVTMPEAAAAPVAAAPAAAAETAASAKAPAVARAKVKKRKKA